MINTLIKNIYFHRKMSLAKQLIINLYIKKNNKISVRIKYTINYEMKKDAIVFLIYYLKKISYHKSKVGLKVIIKKVEYIKK